jgi:hypothetical protein
MERALGKRTVKAERRLERAHPMRYPLVQLQVPSGYIHDDHKGLPIRRTHIRIPGDLGLLYYGDVDNRVRAIASEVAGLTSVIWNRGLADADWSLTSGGTILENENVHPRQRHHPPLYLSCAAARAVVGLRVREGRRRPL